MAEDRYRYISVDSASDDEELIVVSAESIASKEPEPSSSLEGSFADSFASAASFMDDHRVQSYDFNTADQNEDSRAELDKSFEPSKVAAQDSSEDDLKPEVPFLKMQRIILAVLAVLVIVFVVYMLSGCSTQDKSTQNEERATNKVILQYSVSNNKSKSVKSSAYDVSGDGKLDTVKLKPVLKKNWQGTSYLSELQLIINKKKAISFTTAKHSYLSKVSDVNLKLMDLSDGSKFLYVSARDHDEEGFSGVYKVEKNKAIPVITSYSDTESLWSPIAQMKNYNMSAQAVGDCVQITVDFTCYATGLTKATFEFKSRDGSLSLENDEAVSFSYRSLNAHSYDTASLTAARSFIVYRERDLQSYPFEVSPGETCTIESIALDNDKLLFKVKVNDNEGWIANPSYGSQTLFEETSTTDNFDEEASDA